MAGKKRGQESGESVVRRGQVPGSELKVLIPIRRLLFGCMNRRFNGRNVNISKLCKRNTKRKLQRREGTGGGKLDADEELGILDNLVLDLEGRGSEFPTLFGHTTESRSWEDSETAGQELTAREYSILFAVDDGGDPADVDIDEESPTVGIRYDSHVGVRVSGPNKENWEEEGEETELGGAGEEVEDTPTPTAHAAPDTPTGLRPQNEPPRPASTASPASTKVQPPPTRAQILGKRRAEKESAKDVMLAAKARLYAEQEAALAERRTLAKEEKAASSDVQERKLLKDAIEMMILCNNNGLPIPLKYRPVLENLLHKPRTDWPSVDGSPNSAPLLSQMSLKPA